ncbi:Cerato-platanin [Sparassis latifolia]
MNVSSVAAVSLLFAPAILSQTSVSVSYDATYDDASDPVASLSCWNASGLHSGDLITIGQLPNFPFLGGSALAQGFDSPNCWTCWNLTYEGGTVTVLVVNYASGGFNISEEAMDTLTDGEAVAAGTVTATALQVNQSHCGLSGTPEF